MAVKKPIKVNRTAYCLWRELCGVDETGAILSCDFCGSAIFVDKPTYDYIMSVQKKGRRVKDLIDAKTNIPNCVCMQNKEQKK